MKRKKKLINVYVIINLMEGKKGNEIRVSRYYMVMKVVVVVLRETQQEEEDVKCVPKDCERMTV